MEARIRRIRHLLKTAEVRVAESTRWSKSAPGDGARGRPGDRVPGGHPGEPVPGQPLASPSGPLGPRPCSAPVPATGSSTRPGRHVHRGGGLGAPLRRLTHHRRRVTRPPYHWQSATVSLSMVRRWWPRHGLQLQVGPGQGVQGPAQALRRSPAAGLPGLLHGELGRAPPRPLQEGRLVGGGQRQRPAAQVVLEEREQLEGVAVRQEVGEAPQRGADVALPHRVGVVPHGSSGRLRNREATSASVTDPSMVASWSSAWPREAMSDPNRCTSAAAAPAVKLTRRSRAAPPSQSAASRSRSFLTVTFSPSRSTTRPRGAGREPADTKQITAVAASRPPSSAATTSASPLSRFWASTTSRPAPPPETASRSAGRGRCSRPRGAGHPRRRRWTPPGGDVDAVDAIDPGLLESRIPASKHLVAIAGPASPAPATRSTAVATAAP